MTISSELVFRKALTLSKTREEVSIKNEPTQPITSVLTSLFHEDGSMRKTTRAELLLKLGENGPGVKLLPKHVVSSAIYIHDAMAVLLMMPGDKHASFQQLATWTHFFTASEMRTLLLMCLIDMTIKSL